MTTFIMNRYLWNPYQMWSFFPYQVLNIVQYTRWQQDKASETPVRVSLSPFLNSHPVAAKASKDQGRVLVMGRAGVVGLMDEHAGRSHFSTIWKMSLPSFWGFCVTVTQEQIILKFFDDIFVTLHAEILCSGPKVRKHHWGYVICPLWVCCKSS